MDCNLSYWRLSEKCCSRACTQKCASAKELVFMHTQPLRHVNTLDKHIMFTTRKIQSKNVCGMCFALLLKRTGKMSPLSSLSSRRHSHHHLNDYDVC